MQKSLKRSNFRRVVTGRQWSQRENLKATPIVFTPGRAIARPGYTGLTSEQFDELVDRVGQRLSWDSGQARPRELKLRQAVKAVVTYFRTHVTQEVIDELFCVDQSTIFRAISDLEEIIAETLDEFVPELPGEIEGRVEMVDGSLCPWG